MNFRLCYKQYDYKSTHGAHRAFQEDTGESLLGLLNDVLHMSGQMNGMTTAEATSSFLKVCPEILGAKAFYYLAKECNGALTIDEIEDAVFHTSQRIPTSSDSFGNPWYLVLAKVGAEVIEDLTSLALKKKQNQDLTD